MTAPTTTAAAATVVAMTTIRVPTTTTDLARPPAATWTVPMREHGPARPTSRWRRVDPACRMTSGSTGSGGRPSATIRGLRVRAEGQADERAIVAAVLAGDRDAFRRLVERESAAVVRACYRVLGDQADAEDAAQEAFVTAYRSLATWRSEGPFGAWLTRIAIRISLRQAGRRRTVTWRDPAGSQPADGTPSAADQAVERASVGASARTDPAALSMRSEQAMEVRRAVTMLPEPYREVVALRFFGDATLDEIARQTGRPLARSRPTCTAALRGSGRSSIGPSHERTRTAVRSIRAGRPRRGPAVRRRGGRPAGDRT